jgi:hypothetical protein
MMLSNRFTGLFLILLLATAGLMPAGAQQTTLDGQWRSDSGSTVSIATSTSGLNITVTPPNGQAARWQGRWLRQWNLFDYQANGATCTGQVVDNNTITITSTNGLTNTWYRQQGAPPSNAGNFASFVQGRWHSTSGATIDVKSSGGAVQLTVYGTQGTYTGSGTWVDGSSFRYGLNGYQEQWIATVLSDGRVKVISTAPNGKITYWSRG